MGEMRNKCSTLMENQQEISHFRDLGIDESMVLNWNFIKWGVGFGLNLSLSE
jgi:hypothetical protein